MCTTPASTVPSAAGPTSLFLYPALCVRASAGKCLPDVSRLLHRLRATPRISSMPSFKPTSEETTLFRVDIPSAAADCRATISGCSHSVTASTQSLGASEAQVVSRGLQRRARHHSEADGHSLKVALKGGAGGLRRRPKQPLDHVAAWLPFITVALLRRRLINHRPAPAGSGMACSKPLGTQKWPYRHNQALLGAAQKSKGIAGFSNTSSGWLEASLQRPVLNPFSQPYIGDIVGQVRPLSELPEIIATAETLNAKTIWTQSGLSSVREKDRKGWWVPKDELRSAQNWFNRPA